MTAYVAREPFWTFDPDGNDILVPKGARVEEDDFYHSKNHDLFELAPEVGFFGRPVKGTTMIVEDPAKPAVPAGPGTPPEQAAAAPEAQPVVVAPEPPVAPPKANTGVKSSMSTPRRTLPAPRKSTK